MADIEDRVTVNMICSTLNALCGVPGNLLILKFYTKDGFGEISAHHLCIVHLAIADFIACLFGEIWDVYQYINFNVVEQMPNIMTWIFGLFYLIMFVGTSASGGILLIMAYDRFSKITKPLQRDHNTNRKINKMTIACYVIAFIGIFPSDLFVDDRNLELALNSISYIIGVFSLVVAPIFGNIWFYFKIKRYLIRQVGDVNVSQQQRRRRQRNETAVKTLKWLTVFMLICVAGPKIFISIIFATFITGKKSFRNGIVTDSMAIKILFLISNNLLYINNAVNVFVYYKTMKEFRNWIKSQFGFHQRRNASSQQQQQESQLAFLR